MTATSTPTFDMLLNTREPRSTHERGMLLENLFAV
jgi:hypothetical protein